MMSDRIKTLISQLKREQPSLAKDPTFGALEEEALGEASAESVDEAPADMEQPDMAAEGEMPEGAKGAEAPVPGVVGDSAASEDEATAEDGVDTTGLYSSFALGGEGKRKTPEEWEEHLNEFSPRAQKTKKDQTETVTVAAGDTLWGIAKKYLGSGEEWKRLAAENPEIKDPNKIKPGMKIKLPLETGKRMGPPKKEQMGPPDLEEAPMEEPLVPGKRPF